MNTIIETMDAVLFPHEIDQLIDAGIRLCRIMKRDNKRMYPANIRKLYPNASEEFCIIGADFLNAWAE